ncbi:hypothetical protein AZE42_12469 [Rhizopogon vesiculosus]|uniref:Uncharacterized protein n=1 Tax=Rhizopogon vesiculosus TaxID=180088 RepID=A0A1J8Q595_9AGAM|nr:hypothetical protein AZE42_12469 [Rhizopogon vesiculosus]
MGLRGSRTRVRTTYVSKQPTGAALNVTEALPRLQDVRYRMVQRGLNPIRLQPKWCALRPNECDLYA